MLPVVFTFLFAGYAVAWSGFGKLITAGNPYYNLRNAFSLNPQAEATTTATGGSGGVGNAVPISTVQGAIGTPTTPSPGSFGTPSPGSLV